jgi:peptidoglycan/xylan/chitin deacetylase (PgdA/CDA1 family)
VADTLVLCYHGVSDRWPAAVTPGSLGAQVRYVLARGYRPVTFGEAMRAPGDKTLSVTFDDAYRSVGDRALPVLAALGIPATVFVPTDYVGLARAAWPGTDIWLDTPYADELDVMSWPELEMLRASGWEIGSHTCSHPRLGELEDAPLSHELCASRASIERALGCPCTSLAYPFGDYDDRVVQAAAQAGYRAACTLPVRLRGASVLAWPRIGIYRHDGRAAFRAKVSPVIRGLRATSAWRVIRPDLWRRVLTRSAAP